MSRIGKLPVAVPAGVNVTITPETITVTGPKGTLTQDYLNLVKIENTGSEIVVTRVNDTKPARSAHGLYRSLINNMIIGVTQGFTKSLIIPPPPQQSIMSASYIAICSWSKSAYLSI